jgi:hypothetical protein
VSFAIDELNEVAASERRWGHAFEDAVIDVETWTGAVDDCNGSAAQRAVDLPPQLVADDEENDERRDDDRKRHRGGGDERQTGAKAHGSRRA